MRKDAVEALLSGRATLEQQLHEAVPRSPAARHVEAALNSITLSLAFTRATTLPAIRGKARLLLGELPRGTLGRALAVSVLRDLDQLGREE